MKTRLTFIHALSPLHAGTGQGVDIIDLPISREKATDIPFLPGSSVKGTLRDLCEESNGTKVKVFGPEKDKAHEHAGAIVFSDQRLLLLPVRSLAGTFCWATSPYLLQRFVRDAEGTGNTEWPEIPVPAQLEECFITDASKITMQSKVWLEDLDLSARQNPDASKWAKELGACLFPQRTEWQDVLNGRFCILHDDVLGFLLDTATEITARIKMQSNAKTVERGGLWYEESLPTETVLSGLAHATPNEKTGMTDDEIFGVIAGIITRGDQARPMQFGGKATVGRGLCSIRLS